MTHRIQEMQSFLSTFAGLFLSIASTGHLEAQRSHLVHAFVALGTIAAPATLWYGLLPGIVGVEKSFLISLSQIFMAKAFKRS